MNLPCQNSSSKLIDFGFITSPNPDHNPVLCHVRDGIGILGKRFSKDLLLEVVYTFLNVMV